MTRRTIACSLALLGALLAAASAGAAPYAVTDTLGRSLGFSKVPERIVLAGRATLLLVDAVYLFPGAGSRVVAVGVTDQGLGDFFPFLDPEAATKTRFANNVGPEQIAAVRPDLVILKSSMKDRLGDQLEKIGIAVLYLDMESPEKYYADLQALGDLFQQKERAKQVVDWYRKRVAAVVVAVAGAVGAARPSVILAQYSAKDGQTAFTVPPAGWIQTYMTEAAGGTAAWKESGPGDGWKKIGIEQLSAWNPSYTFIVSYQVPAVRVAEEVRAAGFLKGTIAGFPSDFHSWDQADSRWILGLEWLAVRLHPDLFPALDMRKEALAFYSQLYGIDEATVARIVMPRLEDALAGR